MAQIRCSINKTKKVIIFIIYRNVAKVVVYFQTMTLQEVTQQAAWTVSFQTNENKTKIIIIISLLSQTAKLFSSLGN